MTPSAVLYYMMKYHPCPAFSCKDHRGSPALAMPRLKGMDGRRTDKHGRHCSQSTVGKAVALRGLRDVLNVNGQRTDHLKERGEQKEIY